MQFSLAQADYGEEDISAGAGVFNAPMNGVIVKLLVEPGSEVKKDQPVIIMEAMKMEHTLCAPADGQVSEFYFQVGDQVDGGSLLLEFV
jgi:3-methylcrotonyl-CoA carboxylase alpha subunit